jgi:hypothetical protein
MITASSPSVSRSSRKYGSLDISKPYRPSLPPIGIALPFYFFYVIFCRWTWFRCMTKYKTVLLSMWPPLWSSGQTSWLQIQRPGFWEVMGLERGRLSLVSTIEVLLERESSGSGLENRDYGRRDPSRGPRGTLYPQKLALTSPTIGGRSVGIILWRTKATELLSIVNILVYSVCLQLLL